jgi:hypothetical protein
MQDFLNPTFSMCNTHIKINMYLWSREAYARDSSRPWRITKFQFHIPLKKQSIAKTHAKFSILPSICRLRYPSLQSNTGRFMLKG